MRLLERTAAGVFNRWLDGDNRLTRLLVSRSIRLQRAAFATTLVLYPPFLVLSWLSTGSRRVLGRNPRVVWGPTPILTIADSSELLQRLGYDSTTVVFTTYYIRSDFDVNLKRAIANPAVSYWLPNVLFLWSLLRFDVFHFFYDGGLWSGMKIVPKAQWLELPLLRLAGKRVIASAYGADVRMRHLNEMWQPYNICSECPAPGVHCVCDASGLKRAKYYRDWCNVVLAMGDMNDFVFDSRRDVNYWPIDVKAVEYVGARPHDGPVRIVHSPNHREFKGTRFVEDAIASLQSRGFDVELDLVSGVPNEVARERYARADIVFAQCLAGWMGYTEIEAMAAGKPVITYIRNRDYLTHTNGAPVVNATPATLEAEIEKLVVDPGSREELGRLGRDYVEQYWSYEALAPVYEKLHREVWTRNRLSRLLREKWTDIHDGETRYRVGRPLEGPTLGEWVVHSDAALNMRRIEKGIYGQPPFDPNGIPRVWYGGRYVEHVGAVALFALNAFHLLLRDPADDEQRGRFLRASAWLRDSLVVDVEGVGRWFYDFEAVGRDLPVPWVSCFSQSLGLSILLRAAQLDPDAGYGDAATAAAALFRVPVAEGGILWEEDGLAYLEEYPEPAPAHVLNGFVTGMFGLHEYYRVRREPWAKELFDRCCATLRRRLPEYEAPDGLRYDLAADTVVTHDYYYFIVQQLRALHRITGDRFFLKWARRWSRELYSSRLESFVRLREPI
jgi:hypothetical protein